MPLFGYFVYVGSILLAGLFVVGSDASTPQRVIQSWTAADSLRSMAHHGEPKDPSNIRTAAYLKP